MLYEIHIGVLTSPAIIYQAYIGMVSAESTTLISFG